MENLDKLVAPITEESPCGIYIDDDVARYGEFNSLAAAAEGKPEQVMGDQTIAAEEPNWREVDKQAIALFEHSKDARVAVYLAHAWLHSNQLPGFAQGIKLVVSLLDTYWDELHPQLIIDGDDDPDFRVNAVAQLSSASIAEDVMKTTLVASRAIGHFSLRELRLASGEITLGEGSDETIPEMTHIGAAFMEVDLDELIASAQSVKDIIEGIATLESVVSEKIANAEPMDFGPLKKNLADIDKLYSEQLEKRGVGVEASDEESDGESADGEVAVAGGGSGVIRSREDVVKQIDRICEYYTRFEPSSPVPLILNRAKRLVSMDFMSILKDISPAGVTEAEAIGGVTLADAQAPEA